MSCEISTVVTCVEPSTVAPIDTAYAKRHLRAINDADDDLVESWIDAAKQYFEEQTGRPIMRETWEYWLDGTPANATIELPRPPLVEVVSVEYLGGDGTLVPFTDGASPAANLWQVHTPEGVYARRGWIAPVPANVWPTVVAGPGAIRIRFQAGYAETPDEVPAAIKAALLMLVGQFDQFRSNTHQSETGKIEALPFGAATIIEAFKYSAYPSQVLRRP